MSLERIVADLVERIERRFYGKYRGFVVDNADPKKLGRLKLKVPSLLGEDVVTGWALPCVPYGGAAAPGHGFLFIPEVNAGVWLEFEEGDLEFPIWTGTFWSEPAGNSELPRPNDAQGNEQSEPQDPPTCKIIKTKAGHTIQFEDADGHENVIIKEKHGHVICLDEHGITVTDGVTSGNSIKLTDNGINIKSAHGIYIEAQSSDVSIKGQNVTVEGTSNVTVQATSTLKALGNPIHLNP